MKFLSFLLAINIYAAVTINRVDTTATQALIQIVAPTADTCTIQVSEVVGLSPLVDDVNSALFTNANTEAVRTATSWVSGINTVRILRVGLRTSALALDGFWHSRALAADTLHYVSITCNAVTATTTFRTLVPGGITPELPPTDSAAWGQLAFPQFTDFTKPIIEPQTGLKIYSANPSGWSTSQNVVVSANWYSGGTGWTNLANVTGYGTIVATTNNTNTLSVYLDASAYASGIADSGGYWPYDNFIDAGIDLYGSGTDATGSNRTIRGCLSIDSGQTCYTSYTSVVLPQTTDAAAGALPTTYPSAYFTGWVKPLPRNAWPKSGSVTVAAGIVTLTKDPAGSAINTTARSAGAYFNHDWVAGTKIFITGSSGSCTNSLCTIASVQSATTLTLSEAGLTLGENTYRSAALAVILNKTNATGSINVSARWKLAKGYAHDIWTGGCAQVTVTAGDGTVGWPCIFPRVRQDAGGLYLIGQNGVIRFISPFVNHGCTNGDANDCPNGAISLLGPTKPQFDTADPTKMYVSVNTAGGKIGLFLVQYSGTWAAYAQYNSINITPPATTELTWTNITPAAGGLDLRTQILANTNYNESVWPALNGSQIQSAGLVGPYWLFYSLAAAQDSPCWIFSFTTSTGLYYKSWRTDKDSVIGQFHYAGCHAILPLDGATAANGPAFLLSHNNLNAGSGLRGGPYAGSITAVKKSGSFNANTSLPWPIDGTTDNNCPGGLAQWIIDRGAIDGQCIQVQGTYPCYISASAPEAAENPCPYNAAYGYLGPFVVGDFLKDNVGGGGFGDNEGFMVVQLTDTGSGTFTAYLQRNANFSYCAYGMISDVPSKDGNQSAGQLVHTNGWTYKAVPRGACNAALFLVDMVNNVAYQYNENSTRGHYAVFASNPGRITLVGSGTNTYALQINRLLANIYNVADYNNPQGPTFAGYQTNTANVQSYIDAKQFSASATLKQYAFDFRHYNGGTGVDIEYPSQTLGSALNLTLQGGTTSVYKISFTGTASIKHQSLSVWVGEKYLIEKSSAATGNQLTDSDAWKFCYALNAGECRTGSSVDDLYAVIPRLDSKANCWASQINQRIPCAFVGPTNAMKLTQVKVSTYDSSAQGQRWLGYLLMGPGQQYVYSNVITTSDASYLLFGGYLTSGYHTALMMTKLPPFPNDSISRSTFVPIKVTGSGSSVVVQFGYEEFGSSTSFYCTARAESCKVAASGINESVPFKFAGESLSGVVGQYEIIIPAISGRLLYWRVVDNGVPGQLQVTRIL